jgi:hypothetical protein
MAKAMRLVARLLTRCGAPWSPSLDERMNKLTAGVGREWRMKKLLRE